MSSSIQTQRSRRIAGMLMALILTLCMAFSTAVQTSAVTTADEKVDKVKNSILQVVMTYQPDNEVPCYSMGTCFLINSTTAISCAHIFDASINEKFADDLKRYYGRDHVFNEKYIKKVQILVNGGVPVNATLRKINLIADYSVIKLDETVARPTVTFGYSKDVKITQQVYTLGFPALVSQDSVTYTTDQVAITGSSVSNIPTTNGVDLITHNANISEGNSGGPLVDENGLVIGINIGAYVQDDSYFAATAIDQVSALLDDLDIEYQREKSPENVKTEATTAAKAETEETTVKPTAAPATTEKPTEIAGGGTDGNDNDMTKTIIIIAIAVLAVIVIGVVIVIIVLNSKKKKGTQPPQGGTVAPGPMPSGVPKSPVYGGQPYNRQQSAPTVPSTEGAGETSVLNDGAGETTVLGNQNAGGTMIRKRNNEKISINKPEFIIGKERRRVDYCISDNNSISRAHAKIKVRAGRCYISDLGSTNCTYVNGVKLSPNQEVILSKGDKIKISDEEFEFLG